jgi:hypothetical protein
MGEFIYNEFFLLINPFGYDRPPISSAFMARLPNTYKEKLSIVFCFSPAPEFIQVTAEVSRIIGKIFQTQDNF